MSFRDPRLLILLALVPAIVTAHVAGVRRRSRRSIALAAQGLVVTGAARLKWKRHVPFALLTLALTMMLVALARPETNLTTPRRLGTVILAFDVSNSMRAADLEPTRLDAAKSAARSFVEDQPSTIKVGIVSFGDGAAVIQEPSDVRADVLAAIDRLTPGGGTSLGQGLYAALGAIAGRPIVIDEAALTSDTAEVDIGFFPSATIIVLSDGENTGRPDPAIVAELASSAGVRVHAVGIGTDEGTVVDIEGFSVATTLDREMLTRIAEDTDGTYYEASDAATLEEIYGSIDLQLTSETKKREITALFTIAGAAFLAFGSLLSVFLFGRVI